jgi:hypothetical protein
VKSSFRTLAQEIMFRQVELMGRQKSTISRVHNGMLVGLADLVDQAVSSILGLQMELASSLPVQITESELLFFPRISLMILPLESFSRHTQFMTTLRRSIASIYTHTSCSPNLPQLFTCQLPLTYQSAS